MPIPSNSIEMAMCVSPLNHTPREAVPDRCFLNMKARHGLDRILTTCCISSLLFTLLVMTGCSSTHQPPSKGSSYDKAYAEVQKNHASLSKVRSEENKLEHTAEKKEPLKLEPVLPSYDPLRDTPVSLSVRDKPLQDILYVIARNAGLNLVISPDISLDKRVTVSFEQTSSHTVVEKLLQAYDLDWSVSDNVMTIQRFTEKTFDLGFLNSKSEVITNSGGNIFGQGGDRGGFGGSRGSNGGGAQGNTSFSGQFRINSSLAQGAQAGSTYGTLKTNVEEILATGKGSAGYFTLNPVSGTLQVETTPKKMRAISQMIQGLQEKLHQQVIIDARIIEVMLSDQFRFGIDWAFVTRRILDGRGLDIEMQWSGDSGNLPISIIHGQSRPEQSQTSISTAIEALESFGGVTIVSSPRLRVKHSQPALFTSGSSQNFVRTIETRQTRENGETTFRDFNIDVDTLFNGVMLGVVPFIDTTHSVDLHIFPLKSQVDPDSLELQDVTGDGDKITLPKVDVKHLTTSVRVSDGDTVILGGLIDKTTNQQEKNLPGTSGWPFFKFLTGSNTDTVDIREMIIIMNIKVIS